MYYESNYLSHHGVKGMKWGVRKEDKWAKEPKGADAYQLKTMKAKQKYQASTGKDRIAAKKELKAARKEMDSAARNYRRFERDMHRKVGSTKGLIANSDGSYTKRGKTYKSWEVEGAKEYKERMRFNRKTGQSYVNNALKSAVASMALTAFVNNSRYTSGKQFAVNMLEAGLKGVSISVGATAVTRGVYKKKYRELTGT